MGLFMARLEGFAVRTPYLIVDINVVYDTFSIMKTATVADLRNRFSEISHWLIAGEEVTITKRGKPFATIRSAGKRPVPEKPLNRLARIRRLNPRGRSKWDSMDVLEYDRS